MADAGRKVTYCGGKETTPPSSLNTLVIETYLIVTAATAPHFFLKVRLKANTPVCATQCAPCRQRYEHPNLAEPPVADIWTPNLTNPHLFSTANMAERSRSARTGYRRTTRRCTTGYGRPVRSPPVTTHTQASDTSDSSSPGIRVLTRPFVWTLG